MPSIALNDEMNIQVKVRLLGKGNDEPVTGSEFSIRLYDKDVFNDDFLGESRLDDEGLATFYFSQDDFSKPLKLDDKPDFYFVVYKNQQEVFKSKVMSNLDLTNVEEFIMKEGQVVDLGTFLIDTEIT